MKKEDLGLNEKELKTLNKIENKIIDKNDLDDQMDYVDQLVLWEKFPDLDDEKCDEIDEYLREFVGNL